MSPKPARNPFPNYTQMRSRVPLPAWHALRAVSVLVAIGMCALLVGAPATGLKLWWRLIVPLLPLLFMVAPGLWRNICPLAALNQTPRLLRFTRALTVPDWFREYASIAGMVMFILAVEGRRVLFNASGPATAALIGAALVGAFIGGTQFKGKSGWCSSLCPLLPVQRIYGQTPFATVPNSHCQPCVACAKNCYDFNPRVAYLADLYRDDRHYTGTRKAFVGAFPALVLAYFTLPKHLTALDLFGRFGLYLLGGIGVFFLAEVLLKVTVNKLTSLFGAGAISLFYWYAAPVLAQTIFGNMDTPAFVWPMRGALWALALVWVARTWRKESVFVEQATATADTKLGQGALKALRTPQADAAEITFEPAGLRILARSGATLLEVAESSDQAIEAGCRMGLCGADPVCIVSGSENLSAITADERMTLERLGLPDRSRMACCARVEGPVSVSLTPERAATPATPRIEGFDYDKSVARVVVIGNGIAGVTASDHIRRRHPDCSVDIVASEPYQLYNRMGISRLIYGRSAMVGLQLLPDAWYEENRVSCWLNTRALAIDREHREVVLGVGERLRYDRLILAMGASSHVPEIEGFGLPGTFVLRDASDALAIRNYTQEHRSENAVVVGGGPLGLEAAYGLMKLGLHVTVLEHGHAVLARQLEADASALVQRYLEGLGLHIETAAETTNLNGDGRVSEVLLRDGRALPADVVLVAAGISPRTELARAAALRVEKGIVVNDQLRTDDPAIFAVGDVAEHGGRIYGLWPAAVEQGECAAENALGGSRTYAGTVPVTILKVPGVELRSLGRFVAESEHDREIVFEEPDEHRYRKLVISRGRAVGATLIGHEPLAAGVTAAVKEERDISGCLDALEAGHWDVLSGAPVPAGFSRRSKPTHSERRQHVPSLVSTNC